MESMVVLALVGIMSTIAFNNWSRFSVRAKNSEAKTSLSRIYSTERIFYFEWLTYTACLKNIGGMNLDPTRHYWSGFISLPPNPQCGVALGYLCTATRFDPGTAPGSDFCNCAATVIDPKLGVSSDCFSERTVNLNTSVIMNPTGYGINVSNVAFKAAAAGIIKGGGQPDVWTIDQTKRVEHILTGE